MSFRTLLLLLLVMLPATTAFAQDKVGTTAAAFLAIGQGARPMAMGGAQVAVAEGPTALYWNPSGITQSSTHAVALTHTDWFLGTSYQQASLVLGLGRTGGHVGLNLTVLDYGDEEVTRIDRPDGTGEIFSAQDFALGVTYARSLTDRFSVGGTAKYVRQQIWNETANGFAVDLGVLYHTGWRGLRIGMSVANFGTDMKLDGKDLRKAIDIDKGEGNNPRLPANLEVDAWAIPLFFRVGLAMDAFRTDDQRLLVALDAQHPNDNSESINVGAEYAFRDLIFLRGGYRQAFSAVTHDGGWTLGAGLKYRVNSRLSGALDYVFYQEHRLSRPQMFTLSVTF